MHTHEVHMISVYGNLQTVNPQDHSYSLLSHLRHTTPPLKGSMQADCDNAHHLHCVAY